jgi:hypothetical protein
MFIVVNAIFLMTLLAVIISIDLVAISILIIKFIDLESLRWHRFILCDNSPVNLEIVIKLYCSKLIMKTSGSF